MKLKSIVDNFQMSCVNYGKFNSPDEYERMCKFYDMIIVRDNAQSSLIKSLEQQCSDFREMLRDYDEAKKTLRSEREANTILTEELEKLNAK